MPHKESRKILKVGNCSLAITLPKSWTNYYNLNKGDIVEVISNGKITIKALVKK